MTLLDTAYSTLISNQLLVGGVGTLAFGSLMYALRTVPQKMLDIIEKTVWTTVTVENMSTSSGTSIPSSKDGGSIFSADRWGSRTATENGVRRGMGNL
jgi:hypothetical protein